ncbi:MAG: hypothetical protein GF331_25140 [Chitinivibrionales bacterium]|nr:hypothetical protein [Chitinivibrionales bacterium]
MRTPPRQHRIRTPRYDGYAFILALLTVLIGTRATAYPRLEILPAFPTADDTIELRLVMGQAESTCVPAYAESCTVALDSSLHYPQTGRVNLSVNAMPPPRDSFCEQVTGEYGPRFLLPPLPFGRYLVSAGWDGVPWELRVRHPGPGLTLGGAVRVTERSAPSVDARVVLDRSTAGDGLATVWERAGATVGAPFYEFRNVPPGRYRLTATDSADRSDTVLVAATHDIAADLITGEYHEPFDSVALAAPGRPPAARGYREGIEYGLAVLDAAGAEDSVGWFSPLALHYWVTNQSDSVLELTFDRACFDRRSDDRSQATVIVTAPGGERLAIDERVDCFAKPQNYRLIRGDTLNVYRTVSVWMPPDSVRVQAWVRGYRGLSLLELLVPSGGSSPVRTTPDVRCRCCRAALLGNVLRLTVQEPVGVSVALHTLTGRLVAPVLERELLGAGIHRIRLPLPVRCPGVVIVRVQFGADSSTIVLMPQ